MKELEKMVFDHLSAFQALRSYGIIYGLTRVVKCADAAINFALDINPSVVFGGTDDYIESPEYYRNCAALAIERIVKDMGLTSGIRPGFPNTSTLDFVKSLISIL